MKTLILPLLFICGSMSAQNWQRKPDFPGTERDDAASFVLGDEGFVGTGRDKNFACTSDFWAFSVEENSWRQVSSLPGVPRQYSSGISHPKSNSAYLFGGLNCANESLGELWKYSNYEDTWSRMSDIPGIGRSRSLAIRFGDDVWFFGGRNSNQGLAEVWKYSIPEDQWESEADMPFGGRYDLVGFNHLGVFYLGQGTDSTLSDFNDWWSFDPLSSQWERLNDYPGKSSIYNVAMSNGTTTLVCTGTSAKDKFYQESFQYNVVSDSWVEAAQLSAKPFRGSAGFVIDGDYYLACGIDSSFQRSNALWKLDSHVFSSDGKLELYPVPVEGKAVVQFAGGAPKTKFFVINSVGQQVLEVHPNEVPGLIDLSVLPGGLYIITDGKQYGRFVKN